MVTGIQLIKNVYKNALYVRNTSSALNLEGLRYAPELITDAIKISNKTSLAEFKRYVEGFKLEGEGFVPHSENPSSTFMEYFLHRKQVCIPTPARKTAFLSFPEKPARPKIIMPNDENSHILSLMEFKNFMQTKSQFATREEYYQVVDEIAHLMPDYVRKAQPELRSEIIENSGKLFKWRTLMDVEGKDNAGNLMKMKFYDEEAKMQALKEYIQFVEKLTDKKVLIGSPTRMTISVDDLGLFHDPVAYRDVDYILFGHGKGSSLNNTWRFSDNDKNIWDFIEQNVPEGEKVLVMCCEADGLNIASRKALPEMYDKSGNYMFGIGQSVSTFFNKENSAKICKSGVRHIIGHSTIVDSHHFNSFIDSNYGRVKNVYYNL